MLAEQPTRSFEHYRGLPLADLQPWSGCLGKTVVNVDDPESAGAFVFVLNEQLAASAAEDVPSDLGMVRKDITVTAGSHTGNLTIFTLAR